MSESNQEETLTILPKTKNYEQMLCLSLVKKMMEHDTTQLEKLKDEKRDQQDFIIS